MKVKIQLEGTSQPIEYDNAINTYTKDNFYCIYLKGETVHKYPIINIWRVTESYGHHSDRTWKGPVKVNDVYYETACDCGTIGCPCNREDLDCTANDPAGILKGRDVI